MNIVICDSYGAQRTYNIEAFQKKIVSFGRQPDNDIVLNYDFISRVHGVIYWEGNDFYIEDTDSTNGIYVNGKRVKKAKLQNGTNVIIARSLQDTNFVQIAVCENVMVQQPVYGQVQYGYAQPQQPMAWYKFIIYFELFAVAIVCVLIVIDCFNEANYLSQQNTQYLEWADELIGSSYADGIKSIAIQFTIAGFFGLITAILCLFIRFQLAQFKATALSNYYILHVGIAFFIGLYLAIIMQIAVMQEYAEEYILSGGYKAMNEQLIGMIVGIFIICAIVVSCYIIANKAYFDKRKYLFTR